MDKLTSNQRPLWSISRGTLEDAETTIEELHKWEFDGPFLRDFYGRPPKGVSRDAGALEYFGVN